MAEHPAPGHPSPAAREGRERAGRGLGMRAWSFVTKRQKADCKNCSATSGDIKKQFSKSSLNGVVKGCLFREEA